MAKQTFTTGQVLTAAQMTSLQQTAMLGGAASAKTASYTLVAADAGTAISMSNAGATTITVNTGLFAAGDTVHITNLGAGVSTITAGTATVNSSASLALAQYESGFLNFTSTSAAIFVKGAGAAGGGGGDDFLALNGAGTALSGSNSVSVTGLSGNNILYFFIYGASSSAATSPRITFNSDATSKYSASSLDITSPATYNSSMIGISFNGINGEDKLILGLFGAASEQCIIFGTIFGANSSGAKIVNTVSAFNAGASAISKVQQNIYTGSSAISSIQFINGASGTWDAGNVYVYGSA
jgi:hypothetical protein